MNWFVVLSVYLCGFLFLTGIVVTKLSRGALDSSRLGYAVSAVLLWPVAFPLAVASYVLKEAIARLAWLVQDQKKEVFVHPDDLKETSRTLRRRPTGYRAVADDSVPVGKFRGDAELNEINRTFVGTDEAPLDVLRSAVGRLG